MSVVIIILHVFPVTILGGIKLDGLFKCVSLIWVEFDAVANL